MIKKITLVVIVGIGVIVFGIFSFQEKEDKRGPVLGEASIMEVMLAFIESASNNENKNIDTLREITIEEQEIFFESNQPLLQYMNQQISCMLDNNHVNYTILYNIHCL